jgi:hypothetical protein
MPKRSSGKQKPNSEADSERTEETPRAAKSNSVLDEEENRRALDAMAGVTRPANAMPLLKADTREKLLYKLACAGTPLGAEFFDEFPDRQELLELSLDISARLLIVAICNSEMPPTQRIASMRVVAALAGKQLPATEDEPATRPAPPPASIPIGATDDVEKSLAKFREMSKAS